MLNPSKHHYNPTVVFILDITLPCDWWFYIGWLVICHTYNITITSHNLFKFVDFGAFMLAGHIPCTLYLLMLSREWGEWSSPQLLTSISNHPIRHTLWTIPIIQFITIDQTPSLLTSINYSNYSVPRNSLQTPASLPRSRRLHKLHRFRARRGWRRPQQSLRTMACRRGGVVGNSACRLGNPPFTCIYSICICVYIYIILSDLHRTDWSWV